MSGDCTAGIQKNIAALNDYFTNAQKDTSLLKNMQQNPIGVLQSMGIPVDEPFKNAVTMQMQSVANYLSIQAEDFTVEPAVCNDVPPEVQAALEFVVKPWGLVLVVREPAVKYLQGGGSIGSGVLSIIAAAAGVTGPVGVGIALILGIYAAILGIYLGWITLADQGKGVYITETWPQMLLFNTPFGLPVVGPI